MSPFLEKHAHSSMWKSPVTKECHLQNFLHHTLEEGGEGGSSFKANFTSSKNQTQIHFSQEMA